MNFNPSLTLSRRREEEEEEVDEEEAEQEVVVEETGIISYRRQRVETACRQAGRQALS